MNKFMIFFLLTLTLIPFYLHAADSAVCEWENVERIIAIGDTHGDFGKFLELLSMAELIDDKYGWAGGECHLVITGDMMDRGPYSYRIMDLLMKLETEAAKVGGTVHVLLGNHEIMNMNGDLRYLNKEELAHYGGEVGVKRHFGLAGKYGKWLRGLNVVIRINDTLFLHGGLSPKYSAIPLDVLNRIAHRELIRTEPGGNKFLTDRMGPAWYRGLAEKGEEELAPLLNRIERAHNVHHVVVGHTVSKEGIQSRMGARVIMIDVGLSSYYHDGPPAYLLIEKGTFTAVYKKKRVQIFPEKNSPKKNVSQ